MLRQIEGAAAIANSLTDESTRERVLSAQAHSLLQQLRATVVTGDMVEQITRAIQEAPFTETQKDTLLAALSEKVLPGDGKKPKKSTQELQDIGPFLSEEDMQYLTKTELNNLATKSLGWPRYLQGWAARIPQRIAVGERFPS